MPLQRHVRRVPYTAEQMFDLVMDIERYPQFVPGYCEALVLARDGMRLRARQRVGFGVVNASFESEAEFERPHRIRVWSRDRPFHLLQVDWNFEREGNGCCVRFSAEFHLTEGFTSRAVAPLFHALNERVADAFVQRADALYGRGG